MRKGYLVADDTLAALTANAGLPTRVRIRARGDVAAIAVQTGGRRINGASVEIEIQTADKMTLLREIAAMGEAVADLDITPPRLEDLYRYYAKERLQ